MRTIQDIIDNMSDDVHTAWVELLDYIENLKSK